MMGNISTFVTARLSLGYLMKNLFTRIEVDILDGYKMAGFVTVMVMPFSSPKTLAAARLGQLAMLALRAAREERGPLGLREKRDPLDLLEKQLGLH